MCTMTTSGTVSRTRYATTKWDAPSHREFQRSSARSTAFSCNSSERHQNRRGGSKWISSHWLHAQQGRCCNCAPVVCVAPVRAGRYVGTGWLGIRLALPSYFASVLSEIRSSGGFQQSFAKLPGADADSCLTYPDIRDVFLCHAWDDRIGAANELHDLLESKQVSVWSARRASCSAATPIRVIEEDLTKSRAGLVVTLRC